MSKRVGMTGNGWTFPNDSRKKQRVSKTLANAERDGKWPQISKCLRCSDGPRDSSVGGTQSSRERNSDYVFWQAKHSGKAAVVSSKWTSREQNA